MTDMTATTDLIARLEAATEGSRELDKAVWQACGNTIRSVTEIGGMTHDRWIESDGTRWKAAATLFTTSIDAALTLVPEGHWWEIRQMSDPKSPMRNFGQSGIFTARVGFSYGSVGFPGHQNNPALALCIAALRARTPEETA